MKNFIFFLPEFFLIIILLSICVIVPIFLNKNVYKYINIINFIEIFLILNLFILIFLNYNTIGYNEHNIFNFIFLNNNYTIFLKIFIIFLSILIIIITKDHINLFFLNKCDFFIIFIFLLFSLVCLIMCIDLVYAALIIQLQNLSLYILLSLNNKKNKLIEGALKYFFLSSVAFGLYLFGVSIIYNCFGTTKINNLYYFILNNNYNIMFNNLLTIGFIFIIISIFFKLSIVPFHFWAPDVYTSMDRSILIIFAIIPKISLLFFFYKFYFYVLKFFLYWDNFFIIFIIFSFIIGFLGSVNANNLQNLFAYFWIFTVNFFLIFFLLDISQFFFLFLFLYSINILSFCICLIFLKQEKNKLIQKEITFLKQLTYLKKNNFILFLCFNVSIFSLLGLPPLSGFLGKFFLLLTLIDEKYFFLVFIVLFFTIMSCFYYLRLIKIVSFHNSNKWFYLCSINKLSSYILSFFIFFNIFSFFFLPFLFEFFKFLYLSSIFFF